jgi:hypothetical protein
LKLIGWMANTRREETDATAAYLYYCGCMSVSVDNSGENPEFHWTQHCDSDEDIVDVMSVALYYNDRSVEQIDEMQNELRGMLLRYPPKGK